MSTTLLKPPLRQASPTAPAKPTAAATSGTPSRPRATVRAWRLQSLEPGLLAGLPLALLLVLGFLGPLVFVTLYSFMPAGTFSLLGRPTLENYATIFAGTYYLSFIWSVGLALLTTAILAVLCYPLAWALVHAFGHRANLLTLLIITPLFVAENVRLFGWVLFLVPNGVLSGGAQALIGIDPGSILYTRAAIVLGLVYVYLPFMLFPTVLGLSLVPDQIREAAFDLGASRLQVLREIELPLALPGIAIGSLLVFIFCLGAMNESRLLGGQAITTIVQDIQKAFTFGQDWPRGSALSVLVVIIALGLVWPVLQRLDFDRLFGRG